MKKQQIIEAVIVGLVLGAMIVLQWQFYVRLKAVEKATVENRSMALQITEFINKQIQAANQGQPK